MDKLAERLRKDAADIHVEFSPELDNRIRASLTGITPEAPREERPRHSPLFWWASSLTGLAAAVALIVVINLGDPAGPASVPVAATQPDIVVPELPALPLKAEQAMSVSPLEQELSDIQSDLEKARDAVSEDVRQMF